MEDISILDLNNEVHYVYLMRINTALCQFTDAWNNHRLSSERNMSPIQLWISGLSRIPPPGIDGLTEVSVIIHHDCDVHK